jgi:hypothetical protein
MRCSVLAAALLVTLFTVPASGATNLANSSG